MATEKKTYRRIDKPTPNGGAYSIAYFRDDEGKPCEEKDAKSFEFVEYDKNGVLIKRTYTI